MTAFCLRRVTTQYVEQEDRVRLSGEGEAGEVVSIWLSLRLLSRLLPVLVEALECVGHDAAGADALHEFAQFDARRKMEPQAPVVPAVGHLSWLATAVDVARRAGGVGLAFRDTGANLATLNLDVLALRQWLGVLRDEWWAAEWPRTSWPAWMIPDDIARSDDRTRLH